MVEIKLEEAGEVWCQSLPGWRPKLTTYLCHDETTRGMDNYLRSIEPNVFEFRADLKYLATYYVKAKRNEAIKSAKNQCLLHCKYSSPDHRQLFGNHQIGSLAIKYDLFQVSGKSLLRQASNKSLYHIAISYPMVFIDAAASNSPGGLDERRFWWCANNINYWTKYSKYTLAKDKSQAVGRSSSRLLSEVLHVILTPNEEKLITLNVLVKSVKLYVTQVTQKTFSRDRKHILRSFREGGRLKPLTNLQIYLRERYRIVEAEGELEPIDVDQFIENWKLTALTS